MCIYNSLKNAAEGGSSLSSKNRIYKKNYLEILVVILNK